MGVTRIGCGTEVLVLTSQDTTLSSAPRASRIADEEVVRVLPFRKQDTYRCGRTRTRAGVYECLLFKKPWEPWEPVG